MAATSPGSQGHTVQHHGIPRLARPSRPEPGPPRQLRCQLGQPPMLILRMVSADPASWKSYGKVSSEPVDHVVPAGGLNRMHSQSRQARELTLEQAAN